MKKLLSTTAMVVALGFPTMMLAQTTQPAEGTEAAATEQGTQQQGMGMSGFLDQRGESDLYASDLMGHDVYARRVTDDNNATSDQAAGTTDGTHDMARMNRADLDGMDNIGQINEIVLTNDGEVRAIVIGVGGFLGMGEQDVAVTMDQVTFMSDADDQSEMYIVVNTGADMLQDAPAYDRMAARSDAAVGSDDTDRTAEVTDAAEGDADTNRLTEGTDAEVGTNDADRTVFAAPEMQREGYNRVEVTEVSTEMLMGTTVYDVNDNDVGSVDDLLVDDNGEITNVIIDFGGFLGIGSSQVSLDYDELTILSNEGYADVRIYVDATKEQIQAQPQYSATN